MTNYRFVIYKIQLISLIFNSQQKYLNSIKIFLIIHNILATRKKNYHTYFIYLHRFHLRFVKMVKSSTLRLVANWIY